MLRHFDRVHYCPPRRNSVAEQLHEYTGLSVSYIEKADLRIDSGESNTSYSAVPIRPRASSTRASPVRRSIHWASGRIRSAGCGCQLSDCAGLQPLRARNAALWVRNDVHAGAFSPGCMEFLAQAARTVRPSAAMAQRDTRSRECNDIQPEPKNHGECGYFDLATPFIDGWYEMHQLQIPPKLQANISVRLLPLRPSCIRRAACAQKAA